MYRIRSDRLLRGNALPVMQVGFEVHFACKRECFVVEICSDACSHALKRRSSRQLFSNILVPQVWVCLDELPHYLNALLVIEQDEIHSVLPE